VHCLQLHGRLAFRRIAEVLAVSEQTVARRYRRMRADGLVRVVGLVNPLSLGQPSWMVRIQARPDSVPALARALADRDDVAWVTIGAGGTDIAAALRSRSAADRDDLLLERLPRHAQVLGFTVHTVMHRFARNDGADWTVQSPRLNPQLEAVLLAELPSGDGSAARIGPADEPLIAALATDGRASIAELASQTGWSEARTNRRLGALLSAGALYLDVDIVPEVFDFHTTVDFWLSVEPAHLREVGQALAELPEVAFCAAVTGNINVMAVGLFRSEVELYEFVTERIGGLTGVRQSELSPVLRTVKQAGSFVERNRLTGVPTRR
jgi:DNA-binding Lrp family transcriptional regulator